VFDLLPLPEGSNDPEGEQIFADISKGKHKSYSFE